MQQMRLITYCQSIHFHVHLDSMLQAANKIVRFFRATNFSLTGKIVQANRVFTRANYYIRHIMLFGWPCGASFVLFASVPTSEGGSVKGKELKNYKGNDRREYEPKANKFISSGWNHWEFYVLLGALGLECLFLVLLVTNIL